MREKLPQPQESEPKCGWTASIRQKIQRILSGPLLAAGIVLGGTQSLGCLATPAPLDPSTLPKFAEAGSLVNLPNWLRLDPEFMLQAIETEPLYILFVDDSLWKNDGFTDRLLKTNIQALDCLRNELRNDEEFMGALINKDIRAIAFLGEELIAEFIGDGDLMESNNDTEYRVNREIMKLAALTGKPELLQIADPKVTADIEFWLEIVKIKPESFGYANEAMRQNERLLRAYLESKTNPKIAEELTTALKKLDIRFPELFDLEVLKKLIQERGQIDVPDSRPLALVIYTRKDWNHAFLNNPVKQVIDAGNRTLYYEASSEEEVYAAIQATEATDSQISLLLLGGHGNRESIVYGSDDPRFKDEDNEKLKIDLSDVTELKSYRKRFSDQAVFILQSCSTGEGGAEKSNVANSLHDAFPQVKIYSPTIPTQLERIEFDQNKKIRTAEYYRMKNAEKNKYVIDPISPYDE